MDAEAVFAGLNAEQRRAVETVRGPVCILAGAGSGKTTTITRRIANQVSTGAFSADEILAVTFTDKAAREMRERLEALGAGGVRARTFHSAAFAQLRWFRGDAPGRIIASKALMLRHIGNTLPRPYRFRPAVDLATEIEWAKNRRLTPKTYRSRLEAVACDAGLEDVRALPGRPSHPERQRQYQGTFVKPAATRHEPPIPVDLMARVFREYERRKHEGGLLDFEDLLALAIELLEEDPKALAEVQDRYRAFTVDEYQDVNLLQQTLLELWLGARDELCAVGDDYQSIYAFTGATPEYLLALSRRFPHATVVRLEANYRSTPEVLQLANGLVPKLGGAEKHLTATRPPGPEPELRACADADAEGAFVVERVRELHAAGTPLEEIAVLVRLNARSADFEETFSDAKIPFQGAALLTRDAARQLLKVLGGSHSRAVAADVRRVAREHGWIQRLPEGVGEREQTRQNDLGRLVRLAQEFQDANDGTAVDDWIEWLRARFDHGAQGGVHLLTLHRAKGLEWDAVFVPRVEERELPCKQALGDEAAIAEERRLLYVGLTRARKHLTLTWTGRPSRFLAELGVSTRREPAPRRSEDELPPAFRMLKSWRLERAKADEVPAYLVFHNSTLEEIAERAPRTLGELAAVPGVGPTKLERYGEEVLAALART